MGESELPDLLKKERSSPVLSGLPALPSENELFLLNYRRKESSLIIITG